MKKGLLILLSFAICVSTFAQVTESFPNGFRRAKVPAKFRNSDIQVPYRVTEFDNGVQNATSSVLRVAAAGPITPADETIIGNTFYDLQTNNSISNRLLLNNDGSISAAWTFSPNAIQTTTPPFPSRGSGYNYWDGNAWLYPAGPTARQEPIRTGFTNIVVTPAGKEMLISHSSGTNDSNRISIAWRGTKGTGAWTMYYPWGYAFDTWPKAVASGVTGNENVYVIFQGSGASANTASPARVVLGQTGPLYFAKSTDGGQTWGPKTTIALIDSNFYCGFGGDDYSIHAKGDTIAISFAGEYTDVGLLKSYDAGASWEKQIIQKHPIFKYGCSDRDTRYIPDEADTTVDTVYSNSGDVKVLIDNNGMCHVWFGDFEYHDADSTDDLYNPHDYADNLFYWNETMGPDTSNGWTHSVRPYVSIAAAQDFNGNGFIDTPNDTFTTCTNRRPWGDYRGGLTQMPSAGIDANGTLYLTYQTVVEAPRADTTSFHALHRHVFMMTLAQTGGTYNPANWTYPYNLVPDQASGGYGEFQEGVFACMAPRVDANFAYVLYQRDDAPGHGLAADNTCDKLFNLGNSSDIILVKANVTTVGIASVNSNDLFVSQNYPNPSFGTTYVNVGLKKSASVKIEIHDVIGKLIYSENKGQMPAGSHSVYMNTAGYETGIYTYTISAGGEKTTRKMIVQ